MIVKLTPMSRRVSPDIFTVYDREHRYVDGCMDLPSLPAHVAGHMRGASSPAYFSANWTEDGRLVFGAIIRGESW